MNKRFATTEKLINEKENNASWILWCRLCAKDEPQSNQKIILNDKINENTNTNLNYCIEKYLSINVTRDEKLPKMVCGDCHTALSTWANFAERAFKVQAMFADMQSSANYDKTQEIIIRSKYGLLQEETNIEIIPDIGFFNENHETNDEEKSSTSITNIGDPLEEESMEIKTEIDAGNESFTDFYDDKFSSLSDESEPEVEINKTKKCEKPAKKCERKVLKTRKARRTNPVKSVKTNNVNKSQSAEKEKNKEENYFYGCADCPEIFNQINCYRKHMREIHKKDPPKPIYKCPKCSKVHKSMDKVKRHIKVHLPIEMRYILPCPDCGKKFTFKSALQVHIKRVHHKDEGPFICVKCRVEVNSAAELKEHMVVHINEQPFVCEKCGISLRTAATLKEHMQTHSDDGPVECDICNRFFKTLQRLKVHKRLHKGGEFICPECGQQLSSRKTLSRHRLVHSDTNNHKCDICGRAFKRSKTLKAHLILHTGLKPYSCDFCERTFAHGSNCRSHKKKVHPEELAALEAAGISKRHTQNIPSLDTLKAVTRNADIALAPVVSKQSGNFLYNNIAKQLSTNSI